MKILVLGDIHGRAIWQDIVEKEKDCDKIIFLGDYVSSHDGISGAEQVENAEKILKFKEANPEKVVLLRGNHDIQHLGYRWAQCSTLSHTAQAWLVENKERFESLTQWIYQIDDIIFAHAGVSRVWMINNGISKVEDINKMPINEVFGFTPDNFEDCCGTSESQPPTWIRPGQLQMSYVKGYKQVVGHTRFNKGIYKMRSQGLWFCDALPQQYLVIDNGKFKIKNVKKS